MLLSLLSIIFLLLLIVERKPSSSSISIISLCNAFDIPKSFPYHHHHHHHRRIIIQQQQQQQPVLPSSLSFPSSSSSSLSSSSSSSSTKLLMASPRRLDDNIDGPLFVNEKCINCAACSMFAPEIFERNNNSRKNHRNHHHIVYNQPTTTEQIDKSRAAMMACPVAAIRFETDGYRNHNKLPLLSSKEKQLTKQLAINPKFNGLDMPFPRPMINTTTSTTSTTTTGNKRNQQHEVYYVGYHNEKSFGAIPYLVYSQSYESWIMIDTPKFTKSAIDAVISITGPDGPKYLLLTHIDDTDGHDQWKNHFASKSSNNSLKRIIHIGDLSDDSNWRNDDTLNDVEIILHEESSNTKLQFFTIDGRPITKQRIDDDLDDDDVYIIHTPGHTAGSITLWKKLEGSEGGGGILFTGDTYAYTTRNNGKMTGFVQYCKQDPMLQSNIIQNLITSTTIPIPDDDGSNWNNNLIIAPGHGHPKFYTTKQIKDGIHKNDMKEAMEELINYGTKCGLL